jgi:hypothetical protein
MAQCRIIEVLVFGKEGRPGLAPKKCDDVFIGHPTTTHIESDLSSPNAPRREQLALTGEDILVEDDHDCVGSTSNSSA